MRLRLHALVTLACTAIIVSATVAFADETAKPATPATSEAPKAAAAAPKIEAMKSPATMNLEAASDAAIKAIDAQIKAAAIDKNNPAWRTKLPMPKAVSFDASKSYFVHMMTSKGEVVAKFRPDVAPLHVTNFIYLTRMGFYDGLSFHRVISNFMAQGGCPLGNGTGSPGYGFGGEFSPKARHNRPGLLSMANAGPGTDGSQFFLTFVPTPWLDDKHSIFGEVTGGMDVVKQLEAKGSQSGATSEKLSMGKLYIEVK